MAKKRSNNTGTVYKTANGYRAAFVADDGRRIAKRFSNLETGEEEAYAWLHEQLHLMNKGMLISPNEITLGEWLLEYLELYSKQNVRQRTFERYLATAKHCSPIAGISLQQLKPNIIQRLYKDMDKFSGETRKKVHVLLHSALTQAINNRLIQFNPMDGVIAPKVIREEIETFTRKEVDTLLSTAKPHNWYPILLLAAHTGMRLGELLGLRWMDVDLDAKTVFIRQQLQHARTGIIFEEPKTKNSKRKISVPTETIEVLREHRKELLKIKHKSLYDQLNNIQKNGLSETVEYKELLDKIENFFRTNLSELCFTAGNGSPIQPRNFERWWSSLQLKCNPEYQELAKQKEKLARQRKTDTQEYIEIVEKTKASAKAFHKKFHALRHTHATELLANGVPLIDVSRRLGHAKASTTLDLYGHAIPGNDEKAAEMAGKLYRL